MKTKKTCQRVVQSSVSLISYPEEFCKKTVSSRDRRHWWSDPRSAGSEKSLTTQREHQCDCDAVRVQSGHVEFTVTDVYNQRWLSVL